MALISFPDDLKDNVKSNTFFLLLCKVILKSIS